MTDQHSRTPIVPCSWYFKKKPDHYRFLVTAEIEFAIGTMDITALLGESAVRDLGLQNRAYFISQYLDSPVLIGPLDKYDDGIAEVQSRSIPLTGQLPRNLWKDLPFSAKSVRGVMHLEPGYQRFIRLTPECYPKYWNTDWNPAADSSISHAAAIAFELWNDNNAAWKAWAHVDDASAGSSIGQFSPDLGIEELRWYQRWITLDAAIVEVGRLYSKKRHSAVRVKLGRSGWCTTNGEVALVMSPELPTELQRCVLTWDQLLMIKDMSYVRAQALSALRVFYSADTELPNLVMRHIAWQEECLIRYGNHGYEILKSTEPLCKSFLSVLSGDVFGTYGSHGRIITKIENKERTLGWTGEYESQTARYCKILRACTSVQHVVELFGLQKVSGHPMIDLRESARAVREIATKPDKTSFTDAEEIRWAVCALILEHYVPKMGWPDLKFSDTSSALYKLYVKRVRSIHRTSYPLSDWHGTTFGKIFTFDYAPNYLDLMDDKSISYYRSNIAAAWDSNVKPLSERRLLLELIRRPDVDVRSIVHQVLRRDVPKDWKVVTLYPKEKELKLNARMFSMLAFEMRLYFSLTEANLKQNVFPFVPELTMTDSREDVMNRFLHLTAPSSEDRMISFFYELDLSTWNSNWRALVVHGVGDVLDDMFGLPGLYSYSHTFYSESLMNVRVRGERPAGVEQADPPESDLLWYHHIGGTEGIRQAKWSLITVGVISRALRDLNVSWNLSGQGDNQVLCIRFPSDGIRSEKDQLLAMRDEIVTRIRLWFNKVNQVIKPEECLESTTCVTYSKDIFVGGVYYPTTLKFHSRIFPQAAQDFPSLRGNLGGIYSAAVAGSERTHTPLKSLYSAHLQATIHLLRTFRGEGIFGEQLQWSLFGEKIKPDDQQIKFLLSLPSSLGGYPVLPWTSFVYKSGSDPLSKDLASLVWMRHGSSGRLFDRMLSQLDNDDEFKSNPDLRALIQDPFSIPLKTPVSPISGITQETLSNLRPHVRTFDIREILDSSTAEYTTHLIKALSAVRPFNPLVIRDILDCSVEGIADTLRRAFIATRTLQSVARKTGENLIPKMFHSETQIFLYLKDRHTRLPGNPWRRRSVYAAVQGYRSRWKIEGNEGPVGITTYSPFDISPKYGTKELENEGLHAILLTPAREALISRGRFIPYLGGKTREKRSEHGYKIVDTDTTSMAFRKLQLISSQTGGDDQFRLLIDLVGLSRSNTVLSTISPSLPGIYGGKLSHRYAARVGHLGAYYVGSPNLPSHCAISSDRSGPLSGGVYDYPFMFNEHFLAMSWILREIGINFETGPSCIRWPVLDLEMDPLPDIVMRADPQIPIPVKRFPHNKLVFLPDIRVEMLPGVTNWRSLQLTTLLDSLHVESVDHRRMILEAWARRLLRTGSLNRISADRGSDTFASEVMDIAELRSAGAENVIEAFSNVVADEFVATSSWTHWADIDRWRSVPFVYKVAFTLASSIAPVITHLVMRRDQWVRRHAIYDSPTYIESSSLPQAQLTAMITKEALIRIETSPAGYCQREILITDDGSSSRPSELILSIIMRVVRRHWAIGELSKQECRDILVRQIRPAARSAAGEEDRLRRIIACCITTRGWLRRNGKYGTAQALDAIVCGRMCRHINVSSQEGLRMIRQVEVIGSGEVPLRAPTRHQPMSQVGPLSAMFSFDRVEEGTMLTASENIPYPPDPPENDIIRARINRHSRGRGVSGVVAKARWSWIRPLVIDRRVHIVGVGLGGAAYNCLEGGAVHVSGLDLQVDIPIRPHRFIDYCPPLVLESDEWMKYQQSPLSLTSTGDWTNPKISADYLTQDAGGDTWIIDIESGVSNSYWDLVSPVIRKNVTGSVMVRKLCTIGELESLASELRSQAVRFRILIPEGIDAYFNSVIITEGAPRRGPLRYQAKLLAYPSLSVLDNNIDSPGMGHCLTSSCRNLVLFTDDDTIEIALKYIWWFYKSSKGDYESRLGYRRWTDVLWALIGLVWTTIRKEERVQWIAAARRHGVARVTLNEERIEALWSRGLEMHLTKTCASLLD